MGTMLHVPSFMWRLDQMQGALGSLVSLAKLELKASDYMRTRIWHGTIDDPYVRETMQVVGVDQILWGSDFPHIRSIGLEAHDTIAELYRDVPSADVEKLIASNVSTLYSL